MTTGCVVLEKFSRRKCFNLLFFSSTPKIVNFLTILRYYEWWNTPGSSVRVCILASQHTARVFCMILNSLLFPFDNSLSLSLHLTWFFYARCRTLWLFRIFFSLASGARTQTCITYSAYVTYENSDALACNAVIDLASTLDSTIAAVRCFLRRIRRFQNLV